MQNKDQKNRIAEGLADVIQDYLKQNPILESVTIGLNWPAHIRDLDPPGLIVSAAGDVDSLRGEEILVMLQQWLLVHSRLTRMLVAATEREQMKLTDAATTLRYVEMLHDKARQASVETPFREILRIAATEGCGSTIAQFDEWFCRVNKAEKEEVEKSSRTAEDDRGSDQGPAHPPPILQDPK